MTFHDKHLRAEFSGRSRTTQLAGWAKSPQVVTHQLLRTPPPPPRGGEVGTSFGAPGGVWGSCPEPALGELLKDNGALVPPGLWQARRSPWRMSRLGFFQSWISFSAHVADLRNLLGSFPEPSGSIRGTFHASAHSIHGQVTGHPTDAKCSLAGTATQASGRLRPGQAFPCRGSTGSGCLLASQI